MASDAANICALQYVGLMDPLQISAPTIGLCRPTEMCVSVQTAPRAPASVCTTMVTAKAYELSDLSGYWHHNRLGRSTVARNRNPAESAAQCRDSKRWCCSRWIPLQRALRNVVDGPEQLRRRRSTRVATGRNRSVGRRKTRPLDGMRRRPAAFRRGCLPP